MKKKKRRARRHAYGTVLCSVEDAAKLMMNPQFNRLTGGSCVFINLKNVAGQFTDGPSEPDAGVEGRTKA